MQKEFKIKSFSSQEVFRRWLEKNHEKSNGLWMKIHKKHSNKKSVTYDEAVKTLLCFGWIDSQRKSFDEDSFLQKITPRRKGSQWSARNKFLVRKLIKENKMHPNGMAAFEPVKLSARM